MTQLDRAITERALQDWIIELAWMRGWRIAHFRPAQTAKGWRTPMQGHPGFPDLVLARAGRVIFAELKAEKGRLTREQTLWLDELGLQRNLLDGPPIPSDPDPQVEVYVWRPADRDQIEELLR